MASFSINMLIHQINKSTSFSVFLWSMLILQNSTLRDFYGHCFDFRTAH
jgi:hypothetical protein